MRHGGGYIRRSIVKPIAIVFYRHVRDNVRVSNANVKGKKVQIVSSVEEAEKKEEEEDDEKQYDPKDPSSIEVEKQRKRWNDMITKYRKEVEKEENKIKSKFGEAKGGGNAKKGKGKEKKGKSKKGSEKSSKKSGKKGGKKGKKGAEEIDWVKFRIKNREL